MARALAKHEASCINKSQGAARANRQQARQAATIQHQPFLFTRIRGKVKLEVELLKHVQRQQEMQLLEARRGHWQK